MLGEAQGAFLAHADAVPVTGAFDDEGRGTCAGGREADGREHGREAPEAAPGGSQKSSDRASRTPGGAMIGWADEVHLSHVEHAGRRTVAIEDGSSHDSEVGFTAGLPEGCTMTPAERERAVLADVPTDLLIDGQWRAATGAGRLSVEDPATGEPLIEVADGAA